MNRYISVLLLTFTVLMVSCSSPRDREASKIKKLEDQLKKQDASPDKQKLDELLNLYIGFVDKFPADTASPSYLYNAVSLCIGTNNGEKAMKLIDRSINEYSQSSKLPEIIFLKAYVYENLLNNLGEAASTYRDFISRFPDNELADDAQAAINNLGKSPEELVREFEAKAAAEKNAATVK